VRLRLLGREKRAGRAGQTDRFDLVLVNPLGGGEGGVVAKKVSEDADNSGGNTYKESTGRRQFWRDWGERRKKPG